ncbi:MAG: hypothetical protein WA005_08420 [Candidatus Binataceae bacterium]
MPESAVNTPAFWIAFVLAETALPMIIPSKPWAGGVMLFLAMLFLAAAFGWLPTLAQTLAWKHSLLAFIVIGASLGACAWAIAHKLAPSRPETALNEITPLSTATSTPRPASLKDLFENDWPGLPAYYSVSILGVTNDPQAPDINLEWRLNGDFVARSKFLAFFLDSNVSPQDAINIFTLIASGYQQFIDATNANVDIAGKLPTDTSLTHMSEMALSSRIFIYYGNPELSLEQMASVEALFRQQSLSVQFRRGDYQWLHRNDHPPSRAAPLTPGSVLLPHATGSGLQIKVTKLSP